MSEVLVAHLTLDAIQAAEARQLVLAKAEAKK